MTFPELAIASMIVATGIVLLDQFSSASAWLLTALVLLIVALRYPNFADELSKLLSLSSLGGKQDPNFDPTVQLPNDPLA